MEKMDEGAGMAQEDYEIFEPGKPKTVKDFDADEQPREKALKYGYEALSNSELLALIMRTGQPGIPVTRICKDLMRANDNKFIRLERMADEELTAIKGIGRVKVMELRAMMEIMKRYSREKMGDRIQFRSPEQIWEFMRYDIGNLPHEEMWALFVDQSNRLIDKMRVSEGSATATVHDHKKVLRKAILVNAQAVILCHNHPSGALVPSGPDSNITSSFQKAAKTLDLRLMDHLIITTDGFYSFHDHGAIL